MTIISGWDFLINCHSYIPPQRFTNHCMVLDDQYQLHLSFLTHKTVKMEVKRDNRKCFARLENGHIWVGRFGNNEKRKEKHSLVLSWFTQHPGKYSSQLSCSGGNKHWHWCNSMVRFNKIDLRKCSRLTQNAVRMTLSLNENRRSRNMSENAVTYSVSVC